jgi:hypothetical protein
VRSNCEREAYAAAHRVFDFLGLESAARTIYGSESATPSGCRTRLVNALAQIIMDSTGEIRTRESKPVVIRKQRVG